MIIEKIGRHQASIYEFYKLFNSPRSQPSRPAPACSLFNTLLGVRIKASCVDPGQRATTFVKINLESHMTWTLMECTCFLLTKRNSFSYVSAVNCADYIWETGHCCKLSFYVGLLQCRETWCIDNSFIISSNTSVIYQTYRVRFNRIIFIQRRL